MEESRIAKGREYWMIYGGPGFLVVVWSGSTPLQPPPLRFPVSKLSLLHSLPVYRWSSLLTGEVGGKGGGGGAKSYDHMKAWPSLYHSIFSG